MFVLKSHLEVDGVLLGICILAFRPPGFRSPISTGARVLPKRTRAPRFSHGGEGTVSFSQGVAFRDRELSLKLLFRKANP